LLRHYPIFLSIVPKLVTRLSISRFCFDSAIIQFCRVAPIVGSRPSPVSRCSGNIVQGNFFDSQDTMSARRAQLPVRGVIDVAIGYMRRVALSRAPSLAVHGRDPDRPPGCAPIQPFMPPESGARPSVCTGPPTRFINRLAISRRITIMIIRFGRLPSPRFSLRAAVPGRPPIRRNVVRGLPPLGGVRLRIILNHWLSIRSLPIEFCAN
jgi:hypothetical protein